MDSLPKLLMRGAAIIVGAGTYDEDVEVRGFTGAGYLTIRNADGAAVKVKTFNAVHVHLADVLKISGLELIGTSNDSYHTSLQCQYCGHVQISSVTCTETVANAKLGAFRFDHVLDVTIGSTKISNKPIALDVIASTVYLNSTVIGTGNTVGIRCGSGWGSYGGFVQKGGANIVGEEEKGYGGQIW